MNRPAPPQALLDSPFIILAPAPELGEWVKAHILTEGGAIHNPDHEHLIDADLEFMWASRSFAKQGRVVLGQCEQVAFRAGGWQKARQEQQFQDWFGRVPAYLVTISADYAAQCSDMEFCALVEHELFHMAHEHDGFNAPKFTKDGLPKLTMRGHDVEEFIGVVRRYGPTPQIAALLEASKMPPEVGQSRISQACGTCLRLVA